MLWWNKGGNFMRQNIKMIIRENMKILEGKTSDERYLLCEC